jgi:hypothetical protein
MLCKLKTFAWVAATALASLGCVLAASAAQVGPPEASGAALSPRSIAADSVPMKHYKSAQWNFALDVPTGWNAFRGQPNVNPGEIIRFVSTENGNHLLAVVRNAYDPNVSAEDFVQRVQRDQAKAGFSHLVTGNTRIGSRDAMTLDFDQLQEGGKTLSCRMYFIIDGTLVYILGFGTTADRNAEFPLYDRMAKSFTFGA